MTVLHPDDSGWFRRRLSATAETCSPIKIGLAVAALWLALGAAVATAENITQSSSSNDLGNLTLEQLINIQVTSVSKKETDLFKSPAAIYVITQEDIRRSGLNSIPELLRMVPGLDVAQVNAHAWAVSSRGFNNQYANKLLVLIDGRSVYTPAFAGVFWDAQDLPLEDIDRIEVIRGPGAALWGANAVNGVINIITKSAKETQGGLVSVVYGTFDQPTTTIRYGGRLGANLDYRAYVKYFNRDGFDNPRGVSDAWDTTRGGFRLDWKPQEINQLTLQGDAYYNNDHQILDMPTLTPPFSDRVSSVDHNEGHNVLGLWTHTFDETSQLTVQTYYDHVRQYSTLAFNDYDTYDVDLQHRFAWGERQDIIWGLGYRYLTEKMEKSFGLEFAPAQQSQQLFSVFGQDEITVVPERLHLTLGTKLEHNDLTGFEVQPSGRLTWTPTKKQTVWASVSRAVRTPSLFDQSARLNTAASQPPFSPPMLVAVVGNPDFKSEELMAYELGYRIAVTKQLSFDLAAFYNVYHRFEGFRAGAPVFEASPAPPHLLIPLTVENSASAETYGGELLAEWEVSERWRLNAAYTLLQMQVHHAADMVTTYSTATDSPQQQFRLLSHVDLPWKLEFNSALYYVDRIAPSLGGLQVRIPSYVRLDLGLVWHPTPSLEIGVWGQNLLDDRHVEDITNETLLLREVPRSVLGRVTWYF